MIVPLVLLGSPPTSVTFHKCVYKRLSGRCSVYLYNRNWYSGAQFNKKAEKALKIAPKNYTVSLDTLEKGPRAVLEAQGRHFPGCRGKGQNFNIHNSLVERVSKPRIFPKCHPLALFYAMYFCMWSLVPLSVSFSMQIFAVEWGPGPSMVNV